MDGSELAPGHAERVTPVAAVADRSCASSASSPSAHAAPGAATAPGYGRRCRLRARHPQAPVPERRVRRRERRRRREAAASPPRAGVRPGGGAVRGAARVRRARRREHVHRGVGHVHGDGAGHHAPPLRRRARPRPRRHVHLQPPLQPHGAGAGPADGGAGGHGGRLLHGLRHVGHLVGADAARRRRRARGGVAVPVRRHPRAAVPVPAPRRRGARDVRGRRRRGRRARRGGAGGDEGGVRGDDVESDADRRRHPDAGAGGARRRRQAGGGQHLHPRHRLPRAARRRRRRPQRLQVHQRRCRHHRRRDLRAGEPGERHDGPSGGRADAAGPDDERQGGLRALGASPAPAAADAGALPPRHGVRDADAAPGPARRLPGPPRPPAPRAAGRHGQPRVRIRRHALRRHGHRGPRQPPHAPPPEHYPVRAHGRQPGLLRDAHVLLRQQHQQRDAAGGPGTGRDLTRARAHVRRLQRHAGAAMGAVRARARAHAAGGAAAAAPQGRRRPWRRRRRQQQLQALTIEVPFQGVAPCVADYACSWCIYCRLSIHLSKVMLHRLIPLLQMDADVNRLICWEPI